MAKKEKLTVWNKKKGSMISSKYLKSQKVDTDSQKTKEQQSAAQAYADKFTNEIKKAFK
ncbi:MAG: hypothetical protein KKD07_00895 [Candidatus Omnitrophica bacterium]|nr:hypothetical protein [Candidatus Omnitrophota bacterium]MBU4332979.1 hypothetical protein [Candidatus Omnitrophota bacterium]